MNYYALHIPCFPTLAFFGYPLIGSISKSSYKKKNMPAHRTKGRIKMPGLKFRTTTLPLQHLIMREFRKNLTLDELIGCLWTGYLSYQAIIAVFYFYSSGT
jgi:hypothetical protein